MSVRRIYVLIETRYFILPNLQNIFHIRILFPDNTLETSMKSWVSDQLSGYATLSYTDDRLTSLKTELENRITTASTYLENMISGLESALTQKIEANGP